MYKLHWLPIRFRLDYKIALLMFKCYKGEAPKYLCELLDIEVRTGISRSLRSYQEEVISYRIPFAKCKTFADRSFSVAGPKTWNSLPMDLYLSETVDSFKTQLKLICFVNATWIYCNYCLKYFYLSLLYSTSDKPCLTWHYIKFNKCKCK